MIEDILPLAIMNIVINCHYANILMIGLMSIPQDGQLTKVLTVAQNACMSQIRGTISKITALMMWIWGRTHRPQKQLGFQLRSIIQIPREGQFDVAATGMLGLM